MLSRTPNIRIGELSDVSATVAFLVSDEAKHINGKSGFTSEKEHNEDNDSILKDVKRYLEKNIGPRSRTATGLMAILRSILRALSRKDIAHGPHQNQIHFDRSYRAELYDGAFQLLLSELSEAYRYGTIHTYNCQ